MARYLELKNGTYYFRQTMRVDGKQRAKRYSLRTSNPKIANILAIQFLAHIHRMNKKFEVQYDSSGNIINLKIDNEEDKSRFLEIEEMRQKHLQWKHEKELEKLRLEKLLKEEEAQKQITDWQQSDNASLYEKLTKSLPKKGKTLRTLLSEYLAESKFGNTQTADRYKREITYLITYCDTHEITTASGLDRKLAYSYLLHLRNKEKKTDSTIKNKFNVLSTFYNHLVRIGEINEVNPFAGHKLEYEATDRESLTIEEIEQIFTHPLVTSDKQYFYILLLLLTTGARPTEICQLYVDDISKLRENFYTIRITKNERRGQTLKTKQSERTIYLHPLLLKHGFVEYLSKRASSGPLFDIPKWKNKNISVQPSEKFTEILKDLNIKNEGKVLYSFRHTVINRLYQKGGDIPNLEIIVRDMIGHDEKKNKSTVDKHYRERLTPEIMAEKTSTLLSYNEVECLHN